MNEARAVSSAVAELLALKRTNQMYKRMLDGMIERTTSEACAHGSQPTNNQKTLKHAAGNHA